MNSHSFKPLWESGAPGALGQKTADIPAAALYPAQGKRPRGTMVVFPGGGYRGLMDYEGEAYAEWLAGQGYAALVVRYRLATDGYTLPTILKDAQRALRWARYHAAEWQGRPDQIGVIGSSAGGHLSALLSVHHDAGDAQAVDPVDRCSSRPDLAVLCYPLVYLAHTDQLVSLMFGDREPDAVERKFYSADQWVAADTSPAFLFHTFEDQLVPVDHSLGYAERLAAENVPFKLHVYERGRHGVALGNGHPWTSECLRWLEERFHG